MDALTQVNQANRGQITIIFHEDGMEGEHIDMELGKSLNNTNGLSLTTHDDINLTERSLASATMATFVPETVNCSKILGYSAIAQRLSFALDHEVPRYARSHQRKIYTWNFFDIIL